MKIQEEFNPRRSLFSRYFEKQKSTRRKLVKFNCDVKIVEIEYSSSEINNYSRDKKDKEKLKKIFASSIQSLGISFIKMQTQHSCENFTSPLLRLTPEDRIVFSGSPEYKTLLEENVKNILIIEHNSSVSYAIRQTFQVAFKHAKVEQVRSAEEALATIERRGKPLSFDIIISNHRLQEGSIMGSDFFHDLHEMKGLDKCLMIGFTKNLKEDSPFLATFVDFLWSQNSFPEITTQLKNDLIASLLQKRNDGEETVIFL